MAVDNLVQFAIVREDPEVERDVVDRVDAKSALLIASGGCTAFTLAAQRPLVALTLLDMNAAQLDLVRTKHAALIAHPPASEERTRLFCTDGELSGCGNFESLFRGWRALLDDLVMPHAERERMLLRGDGARESLTSNKYWAASFEMFFGDAMLEAMFTSAATQHAPRGSYPAYFRSVIERGLARADAAKNPWLHHVLLGHYVDDALPTYLGATYTADRFAYVHASIADAPRFDAFDVISLSNLFDWMDGDATAQVARRIVSECRPGSAVIVRQLNNGAPVEELFAPAFTFEQALSSELHARDRSMFYERLLVLVRKA